MLGFKTGARGVAVRVSTAKTVGLITYPDHLNKMIRIPISQTFERFVICLEERARIHSRKERPSSLSHQHPESAIATSLPIVNYS